MSKAKAKKSRLQSSRGSSKKSGKKVVSKKKKIIKKAVKKTTKKAVKKTVKKATKKAVKKAVKKIASKSIMPKVEPEGKIIGRITHYFSNIEVAVIELEAPLKDGEIIRVVGGQDTDFEQKVKSMQIEHVEVASAKKGDSVGMKIEKKVHEGYKVYKA